MAYFGVDTGVRIDGIIHEFRNKLRQSITDAGKGLSAIRCSCEDADKSGAGTLDLRTFETVLANNR